MKIKDQTQKQEFKNIWAIGEIIEGEIQPVTYELLAAARPLAEKKGCEVWCVLLGEGIQEAADSAFHQSADKVLLVDSADLSTFVEETFAAVLSRLIVKHKPEVVLCGATLHGRSLMPRISVLTESGLSADCVSLDINEEGNLVQSRPVYGGNHVAKVVSVNTRPELCTIRPKAFSAADPDSSATGEIITEQIEASDIFTGKRIIETIREEGAEIKLTDADFIISGGRGMRGPEGFALLQDLAKTVNGAVGASRAAVDSGWISYPHQVGQTGQTVQTRVYIACGISGQVQHLVGMRSGDFIVAINKDPEAPIMKIADVAVVGDLFEIIPELIKQIKGG